MLDESYICSVTSDVQPSGETLLQLILWEFLNVLRKPAIDFQIECAILEDAGELLKDLLSPLGAWNRLLKDLVSDDADVTDAHGNSKSRMHPKPQIKIDAFQGAVSIRILAENLHKTLHQQWLCRLEDHNHIGTLGECTRAELYLESQWILNGNQDSFFFFFLLTGSKVH